MAKTAVYSWRLTPDLKERLEEEAHKQKTSVADLLEGISRDWLARNRGSEDEAEQKRLQVAALKFAGTIRGDDPDRAEKARDRVRQRLNLRRASSPHPG